MRVSEMYLINAEAKALSGDTEGAAEMIQSLRNARFGIESQLPNYNGILQTAIEDILRERRLELAFEGHRYLDVKRLGQIAGVGFERAQRDCGQDSHEAVECNLQATDFRFTFPIPIDELNGNANISQEDQNPGY